MAVKIRLKRMGKIRQPYYRVVVVDARKKRDGKVIEEIGKYHPKQEPSFIEVVSDRAQYWLGVGAQPSEAVEALLKITGDWQTFKGLPGTEGTLRVAEPKRDKAEIFAEALKDAAKEPNAGATTAKKAAKKAPAKDEAPKDEASKDEAPKDEAPKVKPAKDETPKDEPTKDEPTKDEPTKDEAKAEPEAAVEEAPTEATAETTEEAATASSDESSDATETEAKADEKADDDKADDEKADDKAGA